MAWTWCVLKNAIIPNYTIVGARSVIKKAFDEEYTAIAGNPAKAVKRGVYFER